MPRNAAQELLEGIEAQGPAVAEWIKTTPEEVAACMGRLRKLSDQPPAEVYDEQLWTWLVAVGYAAAGHEGVQRLTELVAGEQADPDHRIWFEAQPPPPREREGNTHLDLALGDLVERPGTGGGIGVAPDAGWFCFCEAKWYSDIAGKVTNDPHRNQLARVIENALVASHDLDHPSRIVVTLITPAAFKGRSSRFYAYKFEEYAEDRGALRDDLARCALAPRYPEQLLEGRIEQLQLGWVTYQDLLRELPESGLRVPLLAFQDEFDGTLDLH